MRLADKSRPRTAYAINLWEWLISFGPSLVHMGLHMWAGAFWKGVMKTLV